MLEPSIINQLEEVFGRLEGRVYLAVSPSSHERQGDLMELLEAVSATSELVSVEVKGEVSDVPRFRLELDGGWTGISFVGVPGGHEFSSLVLAILHVDGKGKLPDPAIIDRIGRLRGPIRLRTFMSLSCENCPDVVQALNLFAALHDDFEHQVVDGDFAVSEARALGIQGVPAVFCGDELVSSGKTSLGQLLASLEERYGSVASAEPIDLGDYDVAVVGGGPAGVASAIYAARKGQRTVVIADRLGGQLQETKGIENLISVPYTEGPMLSSNLAEHLSQYDIELLEHRRVDNVSPGAPAALTLSTGETLRATSVIIATGAKWRELGVAGEKDYLGKGVAYCPHCDGPYFKGKDVAVIGGGNSGVEAAIDLAGIVRSVTVIEFADELKADEVLQRKLGSLDNARVITSAETRRVLGDGERLTGLEVLNRHSGVETAMRFDGVFVQIGLIPNSAFLGGIVDTNRFGEIIVDEKGRTSAPGIYAAGDVTTVPYKQIVVAVGEGAKAALAAFEDRMAA